MDNIETQNLDEIKEVQNFEASEIIADSPISEENSTQVEATTGAIENESLPLEKEENIEDENINKVFEYLKTVKEKNENIEAEITEKIRGGFRLVYDNLPMFLPTAHFGTKRTPAEEELVKAVGSKVKVAILELQEDETKRKTVIVSRRPIVEEEFWTNIKKGDKVSGKVTAVTDFGAFIDLGPVEGLIHISRLSNVRVDDVKTVCKVGDILDAVVVECNRASNKVSLSRKELLPIIRKTKEINCQVGDVVNGVIKRFADFGAFVEIQPGIDGLLRNQEISWTKRIANPSEILKVNEEIEVKVISIDTSNMQISLSVKQLSENPWSNFVEKYVSNTEYQGTVKSILTHGVVVNLNDEVDGFIPKSRLKSVTKGNRLPFKVGDNIEVFVEDLNTELGSLTLNINADNSEFESKPRFEDRPHRAPRRNNEEQIKLPPVKTTFSFADLLSDSALKNLMDKE